MKCAGPEIGASRREMSTPSRGTAGTRTTTDGRAQSDSDAPGAVSAPAE
jgi:hypothetical protein